MWTQKHKYPVNPIKDTTLETNSLRFSYPWSTSISPKRSFCMGPPICFWLSPLPWISQLRPQLACSPEVHGALAPACQALAKWACRSKSWVCTKVYLDGQKPSKKSAGKRCCFTHSLITFQADFLKTGVWPGDAKTSFHWASLMRFSSSIASTALGKRHSFWIWWFQRGYGWGPNLVLASVKAASNSFSDLIEGLDSWNYHDVWFLGEHVQ